MRRKLGQVPMDVYEETTDKGLYRSFHDPESGKELGGRYYSHANEKPGRPPGGRGTDFIKVYRNNWLALVQKDELSFHDVGVFYSLMAFLGWEAGYLVNPDTKLPISERELAEKMGVSRAGLHRYIDALVAKGLVSVARGRGGQPNRIFLNDSILYFGKYASDVEAPEFADVSMPTKIKRRVRPDGKEG